MTALYPRRSAGSTDTETTDKAKAHRILDRYRAGGLETQTRVNWALRQTGDLTNPMQEIPDDDPKIDC